MADIEKAIEIDSDFLLAYVNRAAYYLNLDHEPDDATRALAEQYLAMCHERDDK